jgi:hypothetical protein
MRRLQAKQLPWNRVSCVGAVPIGHLGEGGELEERMCLAMNIKVHSIEHKGEPGKECVWLDVLEDTNLQYFIVCDTTYTDAAKISNKLRHLYWFAPRAVETGDWVKLVTGSGTNVKKKNDRGTTTHVFFWGLKNTVWNDEGDCAVLFNLSTWSTTRA